jgi:hypothetical protein
LGTKGNEYVTNANAFKQPRGTIDVGKIMAEITIYTASRSLQGKEVREKFDSTFAELYHDLDMGFAPINFILPWAPLPHNRKRDAAQKKMAQTYMEIIQKRRQSGGEKNSEDMVWNLMSCVYKDGTPVPDIEVAHMMIALLMAGQHSSSSTISWIILRLASQPEITEQLYQEQIRVLGADLPPLTYENLQNSNCKPTSSKRLSACMRLSILCSVLSRTSFKVKDLPMSSLPLTTFFHPLDSLHDLPSTSPSHWIGTATDGMVSTPRGMKSKLTMVMVSSAKELEAPTCLLVLGAIVALVSNLPMFNWVLSVWHWSESSRSKNCQMSKMFRPLITL